MSRDNWARLVEAVVRREQIWQMFHDHSRTPSISTIASEDDDWDPTNHFSGQLTIDSFKALSVSPSVSVRNPPVVSQAVSSNANSNGPLLNLVKDGLELVPQRAYSDGKMTSSDPLPAVEGLQISGEAFPGQQLQACGYSINGTTSCNFEWVRHLEDGSFNYVDGAKQPNYLVTADDVDKYLAIEVQPLDDRKLKGELVRVFANEHRKITCDPVMLNCIGRTLYNGHASYKLSLSTGYLDIWEPATLAIKRDGYSIKCSGPSGGVVAEKFSTSTIVSIPFGSPTEFSVVDSIGTERILRVDSNLTDISGSRDTIVLILRLFILKAGGKKKGKKGSLFFNK